MENKYDSTNDTKEHIGNIQKFLWEIQNNIGARSILHDQSKLEEPEKSMYDEFTPKLRELTYGSNEYKETLKAMGPALKHHYENNRHHPEFWDNGINGMSLLDLLEMVADWKAASLRHPDGSILESIEINKKRFNISDQLVEIIKNTVEEMDW